MGDRANIVIKDDDSIVYLYSHWGGYNLPETLGKALVRAKEDGRLTDGSYLARIIFSEMIRDSIDGTTGFGISSVLTDNEYDLITIDVAKQTVTLVPESQRNEPTNDGIEHALVGCAQENLTWEMLR
jgi:hypothetical protein